MKLKVGRFAPAVRCPHRQRSQQAMSRYRSLYRQRNGIDALVGQIERKMGSTLPVRSQRQAMVLAVARCACWNIALLACALPDGILLYLVWTPFPSPSNP